MPDLRILFFAASLCLAMWPATGQGQGRGSGRGAAPAASGAAAGAASGALPVYGAPAYGAPGYGAPAYGATAAAAGGAAYGAAPMAAPAYQPGYGAPGATGGVINPNRELRPGDQLAFRIEEDREPATPLMVTPGGDLQVEPLDRPVHVAGMTTGQVASELKRLLERDYYYRANVSLVLTSMSFDRTVGSAQLSGYTAFVGMYPLPADKTTTVCEAITATGGLKRFANERKVQVTRPGAGGAKTFIVDYKAVTKEGRLDQDMPLKDGDKIYVPDTFIKPN